MTTTNKKHNFAAETHKASKNGVWFWDNTEART